MLFRVACFGNLFVDKFHFYSAGLFATFYVQRKTNHIFKFGLHLFVGSQGFNGLVKGKLRKFFLFAIIKYFSNNFRCHNTYLLCGSIWGADFRSAPHQQDVIFTFSLGLCPWLDGLCFNSARATCVYFARPASKSASQTLLPYKYAKNNRHRVLGRPTLRYAVGAAGLVLRRRFCTPV